MVLSCIISEIKRDIDQNRDFFIPSPSIRHHQLGGLRWNIWIRETRMVWLPEGGKSLMVGLAVSTEYRPVTDGQTDRWTDRHLATA